MMRKALLICFLTTLVLVFFSYLKPASVPAQSNLCSNKMLTSMKFDIILEDGSSETLIVSPATPPLTIFKDGDGYYLDNEGKEKIADIEKATVNISSEFLAKLGSGAQGVFGENTRILFAQSGSCPNESVTTDNLKLMSPARLEFPYKAGALGYFTQLGCFAETAMNIQLRSAQAGSNVVCEEVYGFIVKNREAVNQCRLYLSPAGGVTTNTPFKVVGNNIEDQKYGIRFFMDDTDVSTWGQTFFDLNYRNPDTGLLMGVAYDSPALSVGTYHFAVRYEGGPNTGQEICALSIPVVASDQTPTPAQPITPAGPDTGGTFQIEKPIPLCQSIPDSADCGNGIGSCKSKCISCQEENKIWTAIGCLPFNANGLMEALFKTLSGVLGGFVMLCIIANGLKVMTSRGNPEALKKAQEAITSCIVGLLVLLFSVLFLRIVGVDILKIPGFGS